MVGWLVGGWSGASQCSDCTPGTFSNGAQNQICQPCGLGTFIDVAGATVCLSCPSSLNCTVASISGLLASTLTNDSYEFIDPIAADIQTVQTRIADTRSLIIIVCCSAGGALTFIAI